MKKVRWAELGTLAWGEHVARVWLIGAERHCQSLRCSRL